MESEKKDKRTGCLWFFIGVVIGIILAIVFLFIAYLPRFLCSPY